LRRLGSVCLSLRACGVLAPMTVFISHSSRDVDAVASLVQHLEAAGKSVWMDRNLTGGDAWWAAILRQIRECEVFVFALSENSLQSEPCRYEFEYANALGLPILPVQVGEVDSYRSDSIFSRQSIDYRKPKAETGIALSRALHERAAQRGPLPDPLPPAPPIPYEYIQELGQVIDGRNPISPTDQVVLLTQLRQALHDEHDESVRTDVRNLLEKLRSRSDVTHTTVTEIDKTLDGGSSPDRPAAVRQRPRGDESTNETATSTPQPKPARRGRRAKLAVIAAVAVILAAAVITGYIALGQRSPSQTGTAQPAAPGGQTAQAGAPTRQTAQPAGTGQPTQAAAPGQATVLPFTRSSNLAGVAVDTAGNVYAAEGSGRMSELSSGATASVELPFSTAGVGPGVAVDTAGTVYATDQRTNSVWKLAAGSNTPTEVPFTGLTCEGQNAPLAGPAGVAVDSVGTVYVTDQNCQGRVLTLAVGSATPAVLPVPGVGTPGGVAVDSAGNVYVTDANNARVLKLAAGSSRPEALPFTGLHNPAGVAVDSAGNVYVTDKSNNRVLKLAPGSAAPTVLSFTGVTNPAGVATPWGVAVDKDGNLYVADNGNHRVLKLAAG
jgi:streptogramin lyase